MKKILAVFLAVLMLVMPMTVSAAAEGDSDYVARMWICHKTDANGVFDHIFLYFENISDEALKVGRYALEKDETVSVGTFGFSGPRGFGLYYNVECTRDVFKGGLMAKSTLITKAQLDKVNTKIVNYNYWDPIFNCTHFAISAWNAGPGGYISLCLFPSLGRNYIKNAGGEVDGVKLTTKTSSEIYKQTELSK